MTRRVARLGWAAAAASALASDCATLVSGGNQEVRILSDPPGAAVTVGDREAATPAVLSLSRDQDCDVVLRKPGYLVARRKLLQQHRNPWMDGNVLSFGSLGMTIDQLTGAAYQFPAPTLRVSLIRQPVDAPAAIRPDPGRFGDKIRFDDTAFDDAGRTGPADGRRAGAYEFCIRALAEEVVVVRAIDPSLEVQRQARGRIGCRIGDELLCVGSTHQPHFRVILQRLAALPYVARIDPFVGA